MITFNKAILVLLILLKISGASATVGSISCDGLELNPDGTLNLEKFLELHNYGKTFDNRNSTRKVSPEEYLLTPKASDSNRPALSKSLFLILSYHAEAEIAKIPHTSKSLVETTSKIRRHDFYAINNRSLESYTVTLKGLNQSKLTCTQYFPEISRESSWISVANGAIQSPRGMYSHSCHLVGSWNDIAPNLFLTLKETWYTNVISQFIMDDRVSEVGYSQAYQEKNKRDLEEYKEFSIALESGPRGKRGVDLYPVNKMTMLGADKGYAGVLKLNGKEILQAKAMAINGGLRCDAVLACTREKCQVMTEKQYLKDEELLSGME